MNVFDPDSIAYAKREAEIEEAWETAVEEAIATVADAYTDAFASLDKHEADFTSEQIISGKFTIINHFRTTWDMRSAGETLRRMMQELPK